MAYDNYIAMNGEYIIEKKGSFPEWEVLNVALLHVERYFQEAKKTYRERGWTDKSFNSAKAIEDLNKRKEEVQKNAAVITSAMKEYEDAARELSAYDYKKISLMLETLGDSRIVNTINKEMEQINKRKYVAKEKLIKALDDRKLDIPTYILFKNDRENNQYIINNSLVSYVQGMNLSLILSALDKDVTFIVDQFIASTEAKMVMEKKVYNNSEEDMIQQINDKDSVVLATPGDTLKVSDSELKELTDYSSLETVDKEARDYSEKVSLQPDLENIDIILKTNFSLSSKQVRGLEISRIEYEKLADIDLEFNRVETALSFMENNNMNIKLPKSYDLLSKYKLSLLKQKNKQSRKAQSFSEKVNVSGINTTMQREHSFNNLDEKIRYYENMIELARMNNNLSQLKFYSEQLESAKLEVEETVDFKRMSR